MQEGKSLISYLINTLLCLSSSVYCVLAWMHSVFSPFTTTRSAHSQHTVAHYHKFGIAGSHIFYLMLVTPFPFNLQNLIRECGGLTRLVSLLMHPSKNINIKAAQVLSNLAMNEKNQQSLKVMEMNIDL